MHNIHQHKILILDFGSQYTQLIARRVREIGVYCEIHPYDISPAEIKKFNPNGIILSGGPENVSATFSPKAAEIIYELNCPILGICYGMQMMAEQLGGKVAASHHREFGHADVIIENHPNLFSHIEDTVDAVGKAILQVWMSHGDTVITLPQDFIRTAYTDGCPNAAMQHKHKPWYGLQFHPEVTHTRQGARILEHFVKDICRCEANWNTHTIIEELSQQIKQQVGNDQVILALSGGVDSSVVAMLLHKILGKQLHCVFVNNGLLRLDEEHQVQNLFKQHFGLQLHYVDASEQFYAALKNIEDPEIKRKIIGKLFIQIFEQEAQRIEGVKWLAQGTIYPDVIESAHSSKTAKVIKSHHNVGGLPETMKLKLIEPLRELFKDEVRKLGLELGLPYELLYRHPFPGPGLGVRILGEVKPEYIKSLQQADAIFIDALRKHDLYYRVSQAFAVFLPVKSVGVVGDARQHEPVIALRAVETVDFMTAKVAELPHAFLQHVANRIINEVSGISRVVYDISSKPPATIEWE